jgi:prepilin-type N-terminal cleavage/methylation domain-containing protein
MLRCMGNPKGLSLVELLITTSIVGMIMAGIVSVDYAVRTSERQQSRTALVGLRTSAAMTDITKEASQAIGDATTQCIRIGNITTDNSNYICIYQSATPTGVADDFWICYTRRGTDLHKCEFDVPTTPNPTNCTGAGTDRIISTVTTDTFDAPNTPFVFNDRTTSSFYFQITLTNRFDPTTATYAAAVAQEHLTNPKTKLTSQVTPGCSF